MIKRLLYFITFLVNTFAIYGQDFDWYKETWSGIKDFEVSKDGIITVAGNYAHDEATVDGVTLNTHGAGTYTFDAYIAQYNRQGKLLWVQTSSINGYGFQSLYDVATDSENAAIITGYFGDELFFCGSPLIPEGTQDMFVAKYNSSGQCLWAKRIGGSENDFAYSVKTDEENNIYVSGNFKGTLTIDGLSVVGSSSMANQIIIKLDPNGNAVWLHNTNASKNQHFDVTDEGIVFIAGDSQNYFELDGNNHSIPPGISNQYFIKLTANGVTDWVKYIDSPNDQISREIVVDNADNAYVICKWDDDVIIDSTQITTLPESVKIVKLNKEGNIEWYREFVGDTSQCSGSFLQLTYNELPCLSCLETEIIDFYNYQNYIKYGLTYAVLDPTDGTTKEKVLYSKLANFGNIYFDKYGALHAIGGDLDGAKFEGTPIPPPDEGTYIYKLEGEKINHGGAFLSYPNPTNGLFTIQLEPEMETKYLIEFYDSAGKQVYSEKITIDGYEQITINGSTWAQGVYQGIVTSNIENHTFKVLIH